MLIKYLIFVITPLIIAHLSIQVSKNKNSKLLIITIILAILIIITGNVLLLIDIYKTPPIRPLIPQGL